MAKLHLLLKKEEINQDKMSGNKIAVVFDVLLATSTITAGLYYGAKEVIPVLNGEEARKETFGRESSSFLLVGEYEGKTIEGFLDPNPVQLKEKVRGKTMILSTTNGTVAINNSANAEEVYVCSLLNANAVAEHISKLHSDKTVVVVCSGSSDKFCLEDFFGAGYFLDCLLTQENVSYDLTDSALAALTFYRGSRGKEVELLEATRVGRMISKLGFQKELEFDADKDSLPIVPVLKNRKSIVKGDDYGFGSH